METSARLLIEKYKFCDTNKLTLIYFLADYSRTDVDLSPYVPQVHQFYPENHFAYLGRHSEQNTAQINNQHPNSKHENSFWREFCCSFEGLAVNQDSTNLASMPFENRSRTRQWYFRDEERKNSSLPAHRRKERVSRVECRIARLVSCCC